MYHTRRDRNPLKAGKKLLLRLLITTVLTNFKPGSHQVGLFFSINGAERTKQRERNLAKIVNVNVRSMVHSNQCSVCGNDMKEIICPYIVKKGKKIFPTNAKAFRFFVCEVCRSQKQ